MLGAKASAFNRLHEYAMDAWMLFRVDASRAPTEEVWGHQFDKIAAAQERSPPAQ